MSLLFFTSLTAYTDYVFLIWNFYIENKILTLAVIGILLLVFSLLFRFIRRKKKEKKAKKKLMSLLLPILSERNAKGWNN